MDSISHFLGEGEGQACAFVGKQLGDVGLEVREELLEVVRCR